MLILICTCLFLIAGFLLFCCCHCKTDYDRRIDDQEQEKFLREFILF